MQNTFKFETFVDVHSSIFEEYLSSVIAKLPERNEDYRAVQKEIEELYEKYPKVLNLLDMEKASELNEQESRALIRVLELKNRLTDMEMESIYFRGCYDGVGYLKKAGIFVRYGTSPGFPEKQESTGNFHRGAGGDTFFVFPPIYIQKGVIFPDRSVVYR